MELVESNTISFPVSHYHFRGLPRKPGRRVRACWKSFAQITSSPLVQKGCLKTECILRHALPNALLPVVTVIGNGIGMLLGGAVVIESIFSIPGVGMYLVGGINARDYNVVQSSVIFLAIAFTLVMLLVDLVYAFIDPRIKAQFAGKKRRKKYA